MVRTTGNNFGPPRPSSATAAFIPEPGSASRITQDNQVGRIDSVSGV